jgi:histidinol-phosphate aminotransferase
MQLRDLSHVGGHQPGRVLEKIAREHGFEPDELLNLSAMENHLGPSPRAVEALRAAAETGNAYPTVSHTDLTEALAECWDIEPRRVWLASGGCGAIDYLLRATLEPGDEVLVPTPGFIYYNKSTRFHHGEIAEYEISKADDFTLTADTVLSAYDGQRVVYLTSPHNPSGSTFSLSAVEAVAEGTAEETLVVVDEAYGEYADGESARSLLDDRDDMAVVRTFSKAYGLAGVRLGYALVPEAWADAYAQVATPFAASELALQAGLAALEDDEHLEKSVETARWAREHVREELAAPTWPSQGNFVLAEVGDSEMVTKALRRRGILIRGCSSFGLPECVRIATGTRAQTRNVVAEVNEVLAD